MNFELCLTFPPNILRKVREDAARRFPGMELTEPDTHQEMFDFASSFGEGEPPALTVTAYPQVALHALRLAGEGRLAKPDKKSPQRPEYARLGLAAPTEEICLLAVIPVILAAGPECAPRLRDWTDLCAPDFPGPIGCPPPDTPMPYLAEAVLRRSAGEEVKNFLRKLDTGSNPIDINKRLGRGELKAALNIPAFAGAFREGPAAMIWPASGALAVPLFGCLAWDAPDEAHAALDYFLSEDFQNFMAAEGMLAPIHPQAKGFAELEDNNWKMLWPGWNLLFEIARDMIRSSQENSPPKPPQHFSAAMRLKKT
ncbi:MAG: ABC transporter substrate-binding protein [Deltaproteobacteria bacterium]|jgi:ABC-type Fe3+ transport system substrate-binding protein|nr:ABC transporter substrate-binding protein [Deltaproteobacteria bacterium]